MKYFLVEYNSKGNGFSGEMFVHAPTLVHAQDRFIGWLKLQSQYHHLWQLEFKFRQVENCILPLVTDNDRTNNFQQSY